MIGTMEYQSASLHLILPWEVAACSTQSLPVSGGERASSFKAVYPTPYLGSHCGLLCGKLSQPMFGFSVDRCWIGKCSHYISQACAGLSSGFVLSLYCVISSVPLRIFLDLSGGLVLIIQPCITRNSSEFVLSLTFFIFYFVDIRWKE